jgi:tetratricopeptide (TPR) repeat protein
MKMKKLIITIFLIVFLNKIYSQGHNLIGHWVLNKHFVYDSTLNTEINIFSGQINRTIDFNENGTLILTLNNGTKVNGTWKISKSGRRFTIKSDMVEFGFSHTLKNSTHDFSEGNLLIPYEHIYPLYKLEIDSLKGGYSIYSKTSDTSFISSDASLAHTYYLKGLQILENNPDDVGGEAIKSFKKANKLRPYFYWEAYYWIGRYTYFNDKSAIDEIDVAIELKPKDSKLYSLRAMIKSYWNDKNGALEDINWALIFSPEDSELFVQRALILKNQFQLLQEAKKDCNRALEINEFNSRAFYERAMINIELDLKDEACHDFKKAKELGYTGWIYHMKDCGLKNEKY